MTTAAEAHAAEALAQVDAERARVGYMAARRIAVHDLIVALEDGLTLTATEVHPWVLARIPNDIQARYDETQAAVESARLARLTSDAAVAVGKAATEAAEPALRREVDDLRDEVEILYMIAFKQGYSAERDARGRISAMIKSEAPSDE